MKNIAIIGAGQLGSRHLQGVLQANSDILVGVVDPMQQSLDIAKSRADEVKHSKQVSYHTSINELSDNLDLVIVATNANIRSKVIIELIAKKKVLNLILEKVLFQSVDEYYTIEILLDKNNINCWVNHPRRMFPIYSDLKSKLKSATQVSYVFQGGDWGLGCNSLHFIDHFSYLVGSSKLELSAELLDKKIYNSKREDFIEFNGALNGKLGNHVFSLYSNQNTAPYSLSITSDVLVAKIDESKGQILLYEKDNDWTEETIDTKIIYYQSELSSILVDEVLSTNVPKIPTYKQAMDLHIPFLKTLLNHIHTVTGKEEIICAIT